MAKYGQLGVVVIELKEFDGLMTMCEPFRDH